MSERSGPDAVDWQTVGVAASGGGVRAARFSAGALFAVTEHAEEEDQRVVVSAVSGSSLLAPEVAWSTETTDDAALRQAVCRIVRYGYWPRRRFWGVVGVALAALGLVFARWQYGARSAPAIAIGSTF